MKRMSPIVTDDWYTVAVTPLSLGWFNVYSVDEKEHSERCPALLLQEHRKTTKYDREQMKKVDVKYHTVPLDTRVAFGAFGEENGMITPAAEAVNYLRTEYRGDA